MSNGPGIDIGAMGDNLGARYDSSQGAQFVGTTGIPVFYKGTRFNEHKSKEQGCPVYDSIDYLKVFHPGEPSSVWDQPVREHDKFVYREAWKNYEAGKSDDVQGTPLSVLFPDNPALQKHLEAQHIRSVQQLANLSDSALQNIQFGLELKRKAQAYLDVVLKGQEFHQQNAKIAEQQAQIDDLVAKINLMAGANVVAAPAKKRGRPKAMSGPAAEAAE